MPPTPLRSIVDVIMAAQAVLLAWEEHPVSFERLEQAMQTLRDTLTAFRREGEAASRKENP